MNKFKNMKIAITDETHLKQVCDVLELMGYVKSHECSKANYVFASKTGYYWIDINNQPVLDSYQITLTDLLRIRDEMVKNEQQTKTSD